MKYVIKDNSANSDKVYIANDNSNVEYEENAIFFDTEDEALYYINENEFGEWAYVEESDYFFTEIYSKEEFDNLKDCYDFILQIESNRTFLIKEKLYQCSSNLIAKLCGYNYHDHNNDNFIGCGFDDEECVDLILDNI
jgi:hypothetical protein